jgi:uncharacterized protein YhaN
VVVLGPNEAGKSAFHRVLTSLVHGIYPATRDQNPFTPWKGGDIEIEATLALDNGEEWEVQRRLLSVPRGHLVRGGATDPLDNRSLPCASHVSGGIYSQVYAIGLADLAGVEREPWDAVRDHLVVGMGSDDLRAPREVTEALDARAAKLWRPDRRGKSVHRDLEAELKDLRSGRDAAIGRDRAQREALGRVVALDRTLDERRREKVAAAARVERLRTLVPLRERLLRIDRMATALGPVDGLRDLARDPVQRFRDLRDRAAAERASGAELAELDVRAREAAEPLFGALSEGTEALAALEERLGSVSLPVLGERLSALEEEGSRVRTLEERLEEATKRAPGAVGRLPVTGFALGVLAIGLLVAAAVLRDVVFGVGGGAALLAAGALVFRAFEQRSRRIGAKDAHDAEIRDIQSNLSAARRAHAQRKEAADALLESLRLDARGRELPSHRLVAELERLDDLLRRHAAGTRPETGRAAADLDDFLGALQRTGEDPDEKGAARAAARILALDKLDRAREEVEAEAGPLEALRTRIRDAERDGEAWVEVPERLAEAEAIVAEIDAQIASARDDQTKLRTEAAQLARQETADLVDSRIEEVHEEMRAAERERDRLFVLARLLERAEAGFRETHQPELLRRAERHLARITGGRYARILTGRSDDPQALHLHADHLPEPTRVGNPLSTGTREQVYLALRLAIVDHLDEGRETLPLLLDEVLVNWDPERRQRVLDLLVEISAARQVFLFTCHPHLAEEVAGRGGRILRLPAP